MNPTIIRLAFSSLLGRTRSLGLLVLPVLMLLLAVVARMGNGDNVGLDGTGARAILGSLGLGVVIPMLCLLVATRLLGNEMEDGTIYYLLSKPIPRWHAVVGKLVAAVTTALLLGALPLTLAALVLDPEAGQHVLGWAAGGAAASVAYAGLFLALSASTRHAVVWGLMYLVVWEGALSSLLSGIAGLSVRAWAARVAASVGDMEVVGPPSVGLTYAVVALVLVLVAGTAWASYRLRGLSLSATS